MGTATRPAITPVAAVAGGFLAGAAGTVSMDIVRYLMSRRAGARESPLGWEFGRIESWDEAPEPGQVARRVIEGFTQHKLPDRWAWRISTAMHWCYGSLWGSLYGVVAGSLRSPVPVYGLPFGAAVWASDYAVLPEAGLYKPIWEYDVLTLARDLGGHLAYGAATGTAFWLLTRR
ncbi:MAG TPA: hypothetical protein VMA72_20390 [Streptosporangiaceae bacterium]|nr:hypothetical protein [Streptosporangiaceae bacterium]